MPAAPDDLGLGAKFDRFISGKMTPEEADAFRAIVRSNPELLDDASLKVLRDRGVLPGPAAGPSGQPATATPSGAGAGAPPVDTGHYDDGHSFGWKPGGGSAEPPAKATPIPDVAGPWVSVGPSPRRGDMNQLGSPGQGNHWVLNPPGFKSPTGGDVAAAYDRNDQPTGLVGVWDPSRRQWAPLPSPQQGPTATDLKSSGWSLPLPADPGWRPGAYDGWADNPPSTAGEPATGREGKAQRGASPPASTTPPSPKPSPDLPAAAPERRSLIRIAAIATAAVIGVGSAGGGIYLATRGTSDPPLVATGVPTGSAGGQGSASPASSASPSVTIPSDPTQAIKEALIRSVTPAVSVHHDTKIVTRTDTQTTRYVDTYSADPRAVYSIGTLADGSPVSAVTVANGTTCSTSFRQTNVFTGQPLTPYTNYGAFGRSYAITDPKFEPDGPGPLGATTTHTYRKIIGNGPPFADQPPGRAFQVNTIEIFIDPATGMIAAVVEYAKFTDANGAVTEQTETRYDVDNKPALNIPKCP